jgi:Na+/H+ antiporter NhaD/arsenite permease-like protein
MTYINTMEERGVFDILRDWLVVKGFSFRKIFWLTGLLAFCLSPVADNLTTALLMATVVISVGGGNTKFIAIACINIVIAANAGGVFSPFGDITTLMVWQKGIIEFSGFFVLFLPAVVNWIVVAAILSFAVPDVRSEPLEGRAEWDSLMFFYGIIMCVGGLGAFGYLAIDSELLYGGLGPTTANVLVGVASAIVDNISVMFAVLEMYPDMSQGQWLLVTLTAGVGGSMLSVGSAAGVAVMGQARGIYTFFAHLKWTWAI